MFLGQFSPGGFIQFFYQFILLCYFFSFTIVLLQFLIGSMILRLFRNNCLQYLTFLTQYRIQMLILFLQPVYINRLFSPGSFSVVVQVILIPGPFFLIVFYLSLAFLQVRLLHKGTQICLFIRKLLFCQGGFQLFVSLFQSFKTANHFFLQSLPLSLQYRDLLLLFPESLFPGILCGLQPLTFFFQTADNLLYLDNGPVGQFPPELEKLLCLHFFRGHKGCSLTVQSMQYVLPFLFLLCHFLLQLLDQRILIIHQLLSSFHRLF